MRAHQTAMRKFVCEGRAYLYKRRQRKTEARPLGSALFRFATTARIRGNAP